MLATLQLLTTDQVTDVFGVLKGKGEKDGEGEWRGMIGKGRGVKLPHLKAAILLFSIHSY